MGRRGRAGSFDRGTGWFLVSLGWVLAAACEPALDVRQVDIAANADGALVADRQTNVLSGNELDKIERHYVSGADGSVRYRSVAGGLGPGARLDGVSAGVEDDVSRAAFAVLVSGEEPGVTHVHGDPHTNESDGTRWDLAVGDGGGTGSVPPVSFDTFALTIGGPKGLAHYELDRASGAIVIGTVWNEKNVAAHASASFGSTPGLNGNDMVEALGVTPDCAAGGDSTKCVVDLLVRGSKLVPDFLTGIPEAAWSDGVTHGAATRLHSGIRSTTNTMAVGEAYLSRMTSEGACTAPGFDLDGAGFLVRVTPTAIELFEATRDGFVATPWREDRIVDADLDGDGQFDTVCSLVAYHGDLWLAWVERDAATHQHQNIELRKVVEKATSGLKDTLKTQV